MKTKISKTKYAKLLKQFVKENKEWYRVIRSMNITDEAKYLFFSNQADSLLDDINAIANKILKNYK